MFLPACYVSVSPSWSLFENIGSLSLVSLAAPKVSEWNPSSPLIVLIFLVMILPGSSNCFSRLWLRTYDSRCLSGCSRLTLLDSLLLRLLLDRLLVYLILTSCSNWPTFCCCYFLMLTKSGTVFSKELCENHCFDPNCCVFEFRLRWCGFSPLSLITDDWFWSSASCWNLSAWRG